MDDSEKLKLLKNYSNRYTLAILHALNSKSLRFVDLQEAVPNERTRSLKIKALLNNKLISKQANVKNNQVTVTYRITKKGKSALSLIEKVLAELN